MTEFEEYTQTGMLGGYRPERVRMHKIDDGKVIPFYPDGIGLEVEPGTIGIIREVYIGGCLIHVHSMFDTQQSKTPTDAMLRVIDSDLEKESTSG